MLPRLRKISERVLKRVVRPLSRLPAGFYTVLGLVLSLAYLVPCSTGDSILALVLLLASSLLDAVDGAVARLRGEAGPVGAFMDSMTDRVADAIYAYGFLLLGFPDWLVYTWLVSSFLTSYSRARFESLASTSMEGVGLMERGDRVLAQAIVLILYSCHKSLALAVYTVAVILSAATVIQRYAYAVKLLKEAKASAAVGPVTPTRGPG